MKILDRYLIKGFLAPFGICVVVFCVLVMLGRYFDKLEIFNQYHAHGKEIMVYLILGLPFWLNLVLPVATMLALLFSLGQLQLHGEWTACRSAGISSARLLAPYFAVGLLISCLSLAGGLTFLPRINFSARKVYRVQIKHERALNYQKDHVVSAGQDGRHFTINWLDVEKNEMRGVVVDQFSPSMEWVQSISAQSANYVDGHWVFHQGNLRRPDPSQPGSFIDEPFQMRGFDIPERPEDFTFEDKQADDMTGREILRRIRKLQQIGAPRDREEVAFQMKLALPFANLLVIALAIPFALRSGRKGRTQTFTYALAVTFFYWGFISICQSLGEQGRIPAWMAAWTANVVFTGFAGWMLYQASQ